MQKVQVRQGIVSDAKGVSALLRTTWAQTYAGDFTKNQLKQIAEHWHSSQALEKQIANPYICFLVAHLQVVSSKNSIDLVGHASANLRSDNAIWLSKLYVLPSAQNKGVGKALLKEVLSTYISANSINLEVSQSNVSAASFYENAGFVRARHTTCGAGEFDTPAYIFKREL